METNSQRPLVIGFSSSLRAARDFDGASELTAKLSSIESTKELLSFLEQEASIHHDNYLKAGREQGLPFSQTYYNLKKFIGRRGLCNSEVALAAALWGAMTIGCEIKYVPLTSFFKTEPMPFPGFFELLRSSAGILMSTPVYFGDRSSLCNDFINIIKSDKNLQDSVTGKPFGGVSVGAKRNGGQETSLIYQLQDFLSLGMLGLGNDHKTTSQYGGTVVAGDVGSAFRDIYGINTSIGTGRRVASLCVQKIKGQCYSLHGPLKIVFIILQDQQQFAEQFIRQLLASTQIDIEPTILNICDLSIKRCLACDICPYKLGFDFQYRCVINKKDDSFREIHPHLIDKDLIVPVVYSPANRTDLISPYQRFLERTRYLRRGDYALSDVAIQPVVLEDVGASERMSSRLITSLIRHHTIILNPMIGYFYNSEFVNKEQLHGLWHENLRRVTSLVTGKLASYDSGLNKLAYRPVGYHVSSDNSSEAPSEEKRSCAADDRMNRLKLQADMRLHKNLS